MTLSVLEVHSPIASLFKCDMLVKLKPLPMEHFPTRSTRRWETGRKKQNIIVLARAGNWFNDHKCYQPI